MLHKDVLTLLFPVDLGGVFDADIAIEGEALDDAQISAEQVLAEIFPDRAATLLTDWERVCGITPGTGDTLQYRRERIIAKLRERGGLSIIYFMKIAESLGYNAPAGQLLMEDGGGLLLEPGGYILLERDWDFLIEELPPGAEGHGDESVFIWRIHITGQPLYYFRAGESSAGERLLDWREQTAIESIFQDIKPAHTQLIFAYA